jgi:hypothetical protein
MIQIKKGLKGSLRKVKVLIDIEKGIELPKRFRKLKTKEVTDRRYKGRKFQNKIFT